MADAGFQRFKKLLKKSEHFITMPRMRLFAVLQKHPALTLKELIQLTNRHDQATAYRNVDLFERLGIINRIQLGWNTKIELSDVFQHHHHHLSCINCGKFWDLPEDPDIEIQILKLSKQKHFKPMEHRLEIRGICLSCQKQLN